MDVVSIISRWVHLLAVVVAVGGSVFLRFVLQAVAGSVLDDETHGRLRAAVMGRWRKVVHTCIALLLLSGGYNFWLALQSKPDSPYHMLFGIKLLLALAVFALAILLTSRKARVFSDRVKASRWAAIMVLCAVIVIMISGVLKHIPREL